MKQRVITALLVAALVQPTTSFGQQATPPAESPAQESGASGDVEPAEAVLTAEELDTLVAPIALYPDTLLLQVLVAATFPVEIILADRFVQENADLEQDALTEAVEAQGWDLSVAALAAGFPTVLSDMAGDLQWTETLGNAMLAQDEDVLDAVQRQRQLAQEAGVLATRDEQVVDVDEDDNIIITPADPEIVYVPTYVAPTTTTTTRTYTDWRDVTLLFTTFALVAAIYNNNRYYDNYWYCRNCVGWGGRRPSYRYGRVNNGTIIVNPGNNRPGVGPGSGAWSPSDAQRRDARQNIAVDRSRNRNISVDRSVGDVTINPTRGDQMRRDLQQRAPERNINPGGVTRPSTGPAARATPQTRPQPATGSFQRNTGGAAVQRQPGNTRAAPAPSRSRSSAPAFQKRGSGPQAGAARQRGASSHGARAPARSRGGGLRK